ncbi:8575_t:CDS:2, partial [Scutellospora calospora]
MIAINYNSINDFYWDKYDESNSLCCLITMSNFEGIYNDLEARIERNANGSIISIIPYQDLNNTQKMNKQTRLSIPKENQIKILSISSD